ncbi:hypothetical protein GGC64_005951 [Mycobacterium sp. OAS707]|uniref:hypothetical protein n=1 Tax=Mycobacterium sp. OAS707 TaxID=2663822 RepID=UPI0019ED141F|nr:hypothetical protein [Mycobacterium sp. OAS707]
MSIAALAARVNQVLRRGHALFGDPVLDGRAEALSPGWAAARDVVSTSRIRAAPLSGALAGSYGDFAEDADAALDAAAGADTALARRVQSAAAADRSGRARSGTVLTGAGADIAALAPVSGTPAAQRTLVAALRARIAQQQRVINAYAIRDARLAAMLRSLAYRPCSAGGALGVGDTSLGDAGMRGIQMASGLEHLTPNLLIANSLSGAEKAVGIPLGALTPDSSPREVAAAIIHEAWRRGYSPQQTIAILSCAMQESGLNPKAVSPNGLWRNIFQQDSSYAGRDNPNLAIAAFFDRLDRHGGPSSADIWKSIFWLQQRPGDPSAHAAYSRGRHEYLTEIMSQHGHAEQMYRSITDGE